MEYVLNMYVSGQLAQDGCVVKNSCVFGSCWMTDWLCWCCCCCCWMCLYYFLLLASCSLAFLKDFARRRWLEFQILNGGIQPDDIVHLLPQKSSVNNFSIKCHICYQIARSIVLLRYGQWYMHAYLPTVASSSDYRELSCEN